MAINNYDDWTARFLVPFLAQSVGPKNYPGQNKNPSVMYRNLLEGLGITPYSGEEELGPREAEAAELPPAGGQELAPQSQQGTSKIPPEVFYSSGRKAQLQQPGSTFPRRNVATPVPGYSPDEDVSALSDADMARRTMLEMRRAALQPTETQPVAPIETPASKPRTKLDWLREIAKVAAKFGEGMALGPEGVINARQRQQQLDQQRIEEENQAKRQQALVDIQKQQSERERRLAELEANPYYQQLTAKIKLADSLKALEEAGKLKTKGEAQERERMIMEGGVTSPETQQIIRGSGKWPTPEKPEKPPNLEIKERVLTDGRVYREFINPVTGEVVKSGYVGPEGGAIRTRQETEPKKTDLQIWKEKKQFYKDRFPGAPDSKAEEFADRATKITEAEKAGRVKTENEMRDEANFLAQNEMMGEEQWNTVNWFGSGESTYPDSPDAKKEFSKRRMGHYNRIKAEEDAKKTQQQTAPLSDDEFKSFLDELMNDGSIGDFGAEGTPGPTSSTRPSGGQDVETAVNTLMGYFKKSGLQPNTRSIGDSGAGRTSNERWPFLA